MNENPNEEVKQDQQLIYEALEQNLSRNNAMKFNKKQQQGYEPETYLVPQQGELNSSSQFI